MARCYGGGGEGGDGARVRVHSLPDPPRLLTGLEGTIQAPRSYRAIREVDTVAVERLRAMYDKQPKEWLAIAINVLKRRESGAVPLFSM